jgi:hypothetical protein
VSVDFSARLLIGRVQDIDDVVTFLTERVGETEREFHTVSSGLFHGAR